MSVGIITALAAWAISGLATTSDPALAVGQMQNGTMSQVRRYNLYFTFFVG